MNITRRLAGLGGAIAAAAALALAAGVSPASAAGIVNGPIYNIAEAGYQIQSPVPFNEVRTTISIPAGSSTSSFIDLAENINGGRTFAIGLVNISGNYFLEGIEGTEVAAQAGVPFPSSLAGALVPLPTLGAPANHPLFSAITGGSYYVEVHYSTREHLVQYVAGPAETDAAVLNVSPTAGFPFSGTFNAPAIETWNTGGALLPVSAPQAAFTRSGVTEPAGHNVGGIAGTRVTFDFFATDLAEATENGGTPSIGANKVTLLPKPALPGVGSAFGVITGS